MDIDRETVDDALDVLQDIVLWELTPARWQQVEQIIERIGVALSTGDTGGLRSAVADLELSGPTRALRIGSTTIQGIAEPVLERRNSLVHALEKTSKGDPGPRPEGARDGRSAR